MHEIPATTSPSAERDVLAFPASVAQQVFWYLELFQHGVTAFNVPLRFRLEGPLDVSLLEKTLHALVDRHEALRTHFEEDDGELLQVVSPSIDLPLTVIDITHLPDNRLQEEIDRLGSIEARRPFQLSTGPMIRAELLRTRPDSYIFHLTIHHSLFDGMSMTVINRELAAIYQAFAEGKPNPLPPLDIQYGDFSVWQQEFLASPEVDRQLDYWKSKLHGMRELALPTDHPRPPVKSWNGEIISRLLPKALTDKLHTYAATRGATLFQLQLAAFKILMARYCDTTDVAIGTPVTGRNREELEPLVGVFINSLILRTDLSANPTFGQYLDQVKDTVFEALENQDLPFEHLVNALRPTRDPGRNPLFQINFNHHRSFSKTREFGGVTMNPIPSRSPGTIFDLHVFMVERDEGWRASCDYSTDLFEKETAERILAHFERLLQDIADHPEKTVAELEILTDAEKNKILHNWSATRPTYPRPDGPLSAEGPVYILDSALRLVPVGIPGTLYLSGGKTAKALPSVQHPEFGTLHPTGDRCRWTRDGNIEPVSLDSAKTATPEIPVAPESSFAPTAPKESPLPTNGDTREKLAVIWKDLLAVPSVGIDDAFFSLGGHSLMALRMFSRIKREFGVSMPLAALISNPTIRALAQLVDAQAPAPTKTAPATPVQQKGNLVTLSTEGSGAPLFCIHGGDGGVLFYRELGETLQGICPAHAIESLELGSSQPIQPTAVEETATAYVQLLQSFQPTGPYRLAGYSFGGAVAFEMACQLQENGHDVSFLGLFDTQNVALRPRHYSPLERLKVFWQHRHATPFFQRVKWLLRRIVNGVRTHRRIRDEIKAARSAPTAEPFSDIRRIQVREENWRAMLAYQPRRFSGKITLFKTTLPNDKVEWPADYGWSGHTTEGLEIVHIEGEHLTLFDPENIASLSTALSQTLSPHR
ncbi:MAG: condensation domain-containing protein [Luteolibacter sp.]